MGATPQEVGQEILTQSMVTLDTNTFGSLDMKLQRHAVVFYNFIMIQQQPLSRRCTH